ncbi:MAG TPA: ABC transporter substrate-binding protein [Acidimicrobiales bacterium]|nr:ABC transporter substrate-binding protein [Acidimicrobiales bacterium]
MSFTLVAAACGGDDDDDSGAPSPTTADDGGDDGDDGDEPSGEWAVDTSVCPDDVEDPIEGTITIGATMPLSGGVAAVAFAPVAAGMQAYIEYANENNLVDGHTLELVIEDDQYNATLTTPAVEKLLDETGVHLFSGMIGTPNNLAVRDLLNDECYPQLFALTGAPAFGDVENFPWTMGGLPPYNTETLVYVEDIKQQFPDGATVAIHAVSSEFGDYYVETMEAAAEEAGLEITTIQRIEAADSNPPTAQITEIAATRPDVILAVPLGAQCPTFTNELANAKAANAGWEPRLYITSTCASPLILGIAGASADGLFTITSGIDVADPKNAELPQVVEYREFMLSQGFAADGDFATAAAGWNTAVATVQVLIDALAESGEVSRASIINAARSLDFHPDLFRDGISISTNGDADGFPIESFQVIQWSAESKTYTDIGDIHTEFEGTTRVE